MFFCNLVTHYGKDIAKLENNITQLIIHKYVDVEYDSIKDLQNDNVPDNNIGCSLSKLTIFEKKL